ncbi:MAG: PD-(D/E)XK nuclease family transposase [Spirochaetaceae bacterium]|nr:PD-(D/E)XK nuclease family transposase [Spirochaetaceae bacterium]
MKYSTDKEKRRKLLREKIAKFCLFDDDFMSKVFEDDKEATEYLLHTILQRDDLEVTESKGQVPIKNLLGRSVRLDIKAKDKTGKLYNIEVQRDDKGASEKRARHNMAMIDANVLLPREDVSNLLETYVIFITEHDIFKCGLPLYHIDRIIKENNMTFQDESHIIYVNGEYEGDDPIGDLMHDFACANPDEMRSKLLAEKTRYYKQDNKGVRRMSRIMEEFAIEERTEAKLETAQNMLMEGDSIEKIVRCTGLSFETVQQLAEEIKAEPIVQ